MKFHGISSALLVSLFFGALEAHSASVQIKLIRPLAPCASSPNYSWDESKFKPDIDYATTNGGCIGAADTAPFLQLIYSDKSGKAYPLDLPECKEGNYGACIRQVGLLNSGYVVFQDKCRVHIATSFELGLVNGLDKLKIKSQSEIANDCQAGDAEFLRLAVFDDGDGFYIERNGNYGYARRDLEIRKFDKKGLEKAKASDIGGKINKAEFGHLAYCKFSAWNNSTPNPWTYLSSTTPMILWTDLVPNWRERGVITGPVESDKVVFDWGGKALEWKFEDSTCKIIEKRSPGWPCSCTVWADFMSPPVNHYDYRLVLDKNLKQTSFEVSPKYVDHSQE